MQRREFIRAVSACAAIGSLGTTFHVSSTALAIDPFDRPKPGKLRLSLAAYSLRKYLAPAKGETKKMDLFEFVDFCHQQGIPGAELTSYYFPEQVTLEYLLKLKQHCHLRGMTISGGAIRNDFCQLDEQKLAADLEHTKTWVDHYALLGAPAIRIFAGTQPKEEELSVTLKRCAKHCETAARYAASKGVLLALENHGGVTAKAEGLIEIVKQVNAPGFGVNLDSGNFQSTEDPYAELALIAPYAVNAQIKVDMHPGGKHQPTDLARVLKILRDAGYSGWVALEYEAKEEPLEAIPRYLEQLRKLVDA
ncbi:MAG: sugar phosphate isomerase/epimerase family protein [Pirellulaceae bacterium]|nr:sugar phosphate isomerase/epimerase family protein [Pirellulaceae bacterium]